MATPNPGVVFCSTCGRQNVAGSRFCNACGASLQRIESPTLTPAAPLPPGVPITPAKPARGRGCLKWTLGLIGVIVLLSLCGSLISTGNTTQQTSNSPIATPRETAVPAAVEAPASTPTQSPTNEPAVRPTDITGVVAKAGNVRNVPGTDGSEIIGKVAAGDVVILRGRRTVGSDTWYQVTMPNGVWGWASSILLTVEEAASAALPEPTLEPTSVSASVQGIGVPRAAVQEIYERSSIGFTFENSSPVDGQPRVTGKSANNLAILELIGPPENLVKATMIVGVPNDNQQAVTENTIYLLGLLKQTSPGWTDSATWVSENVARTVDSEEPITTIQGGQLISLSAFKELGFIMLNVEDAP